MPKGRQFWDYSRHINKNLCPSLHCLLLSSTDDYVLPLTFCIPSPFSDPLAPEYPVHAMGYFQDAYKETEAVVSCNIQYSHAATCCCQMVRFLLLLCSHAWFPLVYSCLPDPSHSQFKSLKLSNPLNFLLDFFSDIFMS